ncbi:MAG: DUF1501 domain-containing protein [Xanthomonadales bacterium]|nr:DUF1501 domain-containing protein [Xanthomonadales bacterium]MDL1869212.1 DUF1501 domain-containing protein [Gammaproteobacteria bacterium PRO6]
MPSFNRRDFLKGVSALSLAAGTGSRAKAWFSTGDLLPAAATNDTLVMVFLRGAMDGLSLLPPSASNANRGHYESYRSSTRVPASGNGAGLALTGTPDWLLHPRASELRNLYNSQHLAVVLAAGQLQPVPVIRSHFDAQANLEFGFGGGTGNSVGWFTRHLVSGGLPPTVPLPAVSMGDITAASLLGSSDTITMGGGADFRLTTFHWSWDGDAADPPGVAGAGAVARMNALWNGTTALERAGAETLASLALLRGIDFAGYTPSGGANYDLPYNGGFGDQLRDVANLIKQGVGLRAVTIDLGNWDTHVGQGNPTQSWDWFGNQVESLSKGLNAFYTDLASGPTNYMNQVSVIVVSEFGRRVLENADGGTDHGYGNVMLALGGRVNGGQVYGTFPGLSGEQLYEGTDVAVTTDYRRVISEALIRRMGNPNIYYVFPGYAGYTPMGIFQGSDLPPGDYDQIFRNGFDGG